ncbi:MAG: hypothetical protein ABI901_06535, partial [Roseiflexaceae bacterium]
MPPDDTTGTSWLRRLLPRRAQGDVVAANIGEGARNVTVGKNIVQIGTLIVPLPFLASVIVVLLAGIGLMTWQLGQIFDTGVARMPGTFNVAIADFNQLDANKQPSRDTAMGRQLSEWVYQVLTANRKVYANIDLDAEATLSLWYDGLPRSVKTVGVGRITGSTATEREAAAAARAAAIGADVIIYGDIDPQRGLLPEFYVVPRQRYAIQEIVGRYQLGTQPVQIDLADRPATQRRIKPRTTALFWLLIGLRYATNGEAERAITLLDQADQALSEWPEGVPGEETLDFVKGQAALFAAGRAQQPQDAERLIAQAQAAFDRAIARDPAFARAYLGRAGVDYRRATHLAVAEQITTPLLNTAIAGYEAARRRAAGTPNAELTQNGATLGIALCRGLRGQARVILASEARARGDLAAATSAARAAEPDLESAIAEAQQALDRLNAMEPRDIRFIGQTELALAIASRQKGLVREWLGDKAGAAIWQRKAQETANACIALGGLPNADLDDVLRRDVLLEGCRPVRDDATKTLERLEKGP